MNNNTHQWSVVEYDDETIQIVPKCWVTIDDDGNMACYWPPFNFFSSNKRYISAVKKSMEAKPEWIKYGATILGTYGIVIRNIYIYCFKCMNLLNKILFNQK